MSNKNMSKYLATDRINKSSGMVFQDIQLDFIVEQHWHDFFELEIIVGGSGYQILNGKRLELKRGSFYLMRLTDFHTIVPTPSLHIYHIKLKENNFSQSILNDFFRTNNVLFFELNPKDLATVEKLFLLCLEENSLAEPNVKFLKKLIDCILIKTMKKQQPKPHTASSDNTPLQTALLYMNMHFKENPSLSKVAKIAHYNASHFSSTFHKTLGMTYSEYLNKLKLSYAKELLLSTDLKINDICFECGFTSTSNFLRLFKADTGTSPLKYRNLGSDDKI